MTAMQGLLRRLQRQDLPFTLHDLHQMRISARHRSPPGPFPAASATMTHLGGKWARQRDYVRVLRVGQMCDGPTADYVQCSVSGDGRCSAQSSGVDTQPAFTFAGTLAWRRGAPGAGFVRTRCLFSVVKSFRRPKKWSTSWFRDDASIATVGVAAGGMAVGIYPGGAFRIPLLPRSAAPGAALEPEPDPGCAVM